MYEAVFIFDTKEDGVIANAGAVREIMVNMGIAIPYEEDMGEREFAYPIRKQTIGHYYFYELEMEPDRVQELREALKYRESVLRCLLVNTDHSQNSVRPGVKTRRTGGGDGRYKPRNSRW